MTPKTLADFKEVYAFFTRKDFVGDITDDNSPDMLLVVKELLKNNLVLMPSPGTCFVLKPVNSVLYEAHLNTTETEKAEVYINTLITAQWLKEKTAIRVLISFIPAIYKSTLHYAEKIGMEYTGLVPGGFLKNGEYVDSAIMSAPVDAIIKELSWLQQ